MVALGLIFFCHSLAAFFLDKPMEVVLEEIPSESEFKAKLLEIAACNNEDDFSNLVSNFPERFDMGYNKPFVTLQDKNDLIKSCSKHIVISSVAEKIFSFRKGLFAFGVLPDMCKFFEAELANLVHQDISVDEVKACFKPCFSSVGTDEHCKETEIVYKWHQLLKRVKCGKLKSEVFSCPD